MATKTAETKALEEERAARLQAEQATERDEGSCHPDHGPHRAIECHQTRVVITFACGHELQVQSLRAPDREILERCPIDGQHDARQRVPPGSDLEVS